MIAARGELVAGATLDLVHHLNRAVERRRDPRHRTRVRPGDYSHHRVVAAGESERRANDVRITIERGLPVVIRYHDHGMRTWRDVVLGAEQPSNDGPDPEDGEI